MDIQVGDRVTYKYLNTNKGEIFISTVEDIGEVQNYKQMSSNKTEISSIEILKIERPKYEVIEEKKELLTEEEKEYLKQYTKFNDINYKELRINIFCIKFINGISSITCYINTENKFKNIKLGKIYKKDELGLEE